MTQPSVPVKKSKGLQGFIRQLFLFIFLVLLEEGNKILKLISVIDFVTESGVILNLLIPDKEKKVPAVEEPQNAE